MKTVKDFIKLFYKVPFLVPYWDAQELKLMFNALLRVEIVEGEDTDLFVKDFCEFISVKYGIATNLARSAIELSLRGLGLGEGDEVILPTFGCKGTIMPIINAGCTPILVDIGRDFNILPESVEKHISINTKAIIIPHLSGKPAKIEKITNMVKSKGILLIEDACQATGGKHRGRYLGTSGNVGIFSFGMGKNMMALGGGIAVTNSEILYNKMRSVGLENERALNMIRKMKFCVFRMYLRRYTAPFLAVSDKLTSRFAFLKSKFLADYYNSYDILNMSALDATLLRLQLSKLNEIISRRRRNAKILSRGLSNIKDIYLPDFDDEHIFTKFIITFKEGAKPQGLGLCKKVEKFARFLRRRGIEPERTYIPLHLRNGLKRYCKYSLPISESLYWRSMTLPVQPSLRESDMMYVVKVIKQYFTEV